MRFLPYPTRPKFREQRRMGVSTVVGAIIVFLIIFTTIAAYFGSVTLASNQRSIINQQSQAESFLVAVTNTTVLTNPPGNYCTNPVAGCQLEVWINDTGPSTLNETNIIIGNATTNQEITMLPVALGINPGGSRAFMYPTGGGNGFLYRTGVIWIKVLSSLGSVATGFYPSTSTKRITVLTQLSTNPLTTGQPVSDSATLLGVTNNAGGTVNYYYSGSVPTNLNPCRVVGATAAGSSVVSLGNVLSSSTPTVFSTQGTYYWFANYTGDGLNLGPITSACEPLTVGVTANSFSKVVLLTQLSLDPATTSQNVFDSSVLVGVTSTAGGTVNYYYSSSTPTTYNPCKVSGATKVGSSITVTNGNVQDSSPVTFTTPQSYYWFANYTGDAFNGPATSPCEPLTVTAPGNSAPVNAITAGALGDLFLNFSSFTYYKVATGSCGTGNINASGYCLTSGGYGSGFTVPYDGSNFAFSVTITDFNNKTKSVILDQFDALYETTIPSTNQKQSFAQYYLVSNKTTTILKTYYPIVLQYGIPKTVVFASASCLPQSPGPTLYNASPCGAFAPQGEPITTGSPATPPFVDTSFILSHGWEYLVDVPPGGLTFNLNSLTYTGGSFPANYGQNIPYTSTLWY